MNDEFGHIGDTTLDEETKRELREVTDGFFDRPMEKAEAFDWEEFKKNEAFKAIMMPSPLFWTLGTFERSFTQKLGARMYEQFGRAVADANDEVGDADTTHTISDVEISHEEEGVVESLLSELKDGGTPDWEAEKRAVLDAGAGSLKKTSPITWDLWVEDFEDGRPLALEIKTPKPNTDQTVSAKRKMLKTVAVYKHRPEKTPIVRFVFPFNPYGDLESYDWWPAKNVFDVESSDGMLIAESFWNTIGGPGTMEGLFNFLLEESENNKETLVDIAGDSSL